MSRVLKPFLAHVLGFDSASSTRLYETIADVDRIDRDMIFLSRESGGPGDADVTTIDGLLAIRGREAAELEATLESFDFSKVDSEANRELVESVETQIAYLNEESYRLMNLLAKLGESLAQDRIFFTTEEAATLFAQAGVAFAGQLKKDYDQLLEFNRSITEERRAYLLEERRSAELRLAEIAHDLEAQQGERSRLFGFLEGSDTLEKYKQISRRLVTARANIESLNRQRGALARVIELRQQQRQVTERRNELQTAIENDVRAKAESSDSTYVRIQRYFDEIVHDVLDEHALLSVSVNTAGSLEFNAEIIDDSGTATSGGRGFTYNKLLCVAFDLALLRAYIDVPFPRFAFHDGVFESLETRKKRTLLQLLRKYAGLGLQLIVTTLDSDLADPVDEGRDSIRRDEIVRVLHDEGSSGRLFDMDSW